MADTRDPIKVLRKLHGEMVARRPTIEKTANYYDGAHNLAFASEKFLEAFGGLFRAFADNWCGVVANAVEERMKVQGFRVDREVIADEAAHRLWMENGLDLQSGMGHLAGLVAGAFYVTAWFADGTDPKAEITVESAANTIVECHPKIRRRRTAGLRTYLADDGFEHAELFFPDDVYLFRSRSKRTSGGMGDSSRLLWEIEDQIDAKDGLDSSGRMPNPLGVMPIVEFLNRPRLTISRRAGWAAHSELASIIPVQDAVNKLCADLLVASEFVAFPQRHLTGYEPEDIIGADGKPTGQIKDPDFKSGPGKLWWLESETAKFGQFDAADLGNTVKAVEMFVQHIASISATPPHYLNASADRLSGEALDCDTPIPTPDRGFIPIGNLVTGDRVFDETGTVAEVTEAFDVMNDQDCWEVCFDDGTSVVTHGRHRWLTDHNVSTTNLHKGREVAVVTTDEIKETISATNGRNHRIAMPQAYDCPEADLPIDPYILGAWLGDGAAAHGQMTCHRNDVDHFVTQARLAGYLPRISHDNGGNCRVTFSALPERCQFGHLRADSVRQTKVDVTTYCRTCDRDAHARRVRVDTPSNLPLRTQLIRDGLLNNKHIPEAYFWGSPKQRLALLQGLMDTDGTVARAKGGVEFVQHDEQIAASVLRLIRSLGHKATIRSRPAKFNGRVVGTQWRICWSALDPVFRMERKLVHQRTDWAGGLGRANLPRYRYVVDVRPVPSRPVRCIQVDSPSHLFLAGVQCVPTHNSIKSAESGLIAKVRRKLRDCGSGWEEVMRIGGKIQGFQELAAATSMSTIWADPETRTESEHVDAVIKKAAVQVPFPQLWEEMPYSPEQIARFPAMRAQMQLEGMAANAAEQARLAASQAV